MARFLKGRTFKYGSNAIVATLIMLGILVMVNVLSNRYHRRFDTTEGGVFSLSDQTATLLDSLKKDVHVVAFFRDQEKAQYENLLKEYAYHSRRFSFRLVDPDKAPVEANRYKIKVYQTSVIEVGDREERITGSAEKDLTNAIARVLRGKQKRIYFLTGHGEASIEGLDKGGYNRVKQGLLEANYALHDSLLLARSGRVPEDCDLLMVIGPRSQFFQAEVDSIRVYLEAGGAVLFLLDPGVQSGLEPMLKGWSIGVNDDYVVDGSGAGRLFGLDYSVPVAAQYGLHPITAKHKGMMTFYMMARSVTRGGMTPFVEEAVELVMTSPKSWGESDMSSKQPKFDKETDRRGPLSLAMAVSARPRRSEHRPGEETQQKTRMVVFGDSDFANNQFFSVQGNGDLCLNAVSWLLEEGEMISIRPKERGYRPISLTERDAQWIRWVSLVVLPLIPVIAGVLVWWKRR